MFGIRKGNRKKRIKEFRIRCFQLVAGALIISISIPITYFIVGPDIIRLYEIGTSGSIKSTLGSTTENKIKYNEDSVIAPKGTPSPVSEQSVAKQIEKKETKVTRDDYPAKKKKKKAEKEEPLYLRSGVYNFQPKWGFDDTEKYIQVVPNIKIPIKWDRRIIFPEEMLQNMYKEVKVAESEPEIDVIQTSQQDNIPYGLVHANVVLQSHPIFTATSSQLQHLDTLMEYLSRSQHCKDTPIFLTMATIGNDLYWQLVENFVYTMVKYQLSDCALIVCVSDEKCMKKCGDFHFPCFNYLSEPATSLSVMEQIAILKLQHIPKALLHGVDVFMLDLDVGFLADPAYMLKVYRETPIVDIFVQEDFIYLMNRTKAGWKTWYTEPLPNIGMFLCRGNNRTAKVFELALQSYLSLQDQEEKAKPGIDQKKVLSAIQVGRGTFALKFAYFTTDTAPLMDKFIKQHGNVYELGGELMLRALQDQRAMAMHTTCYEKSTKVMGLKASSVFWNPRYYDPLRRTLTKQLLFTTDAALQREVQALIWLALATQRSLILPNLLGDESSIRTIAQYNNRTLWPGFRIASVANDVKVSILEPAYYWRMSQHYSSPSHPVPAPDVVYFAKGESLERIKETLMRLQDVTRIVLHPKPSRNRLRKAENNLEELNLQIASWADDSIGDFGSEPFDTLLSRYRPLPSLDKVQSSEGGDSQLAKTVLTGVRNCYGIFGPPRGNSTCFQICE
mmetsp:Transcript_32033/g.46173  ORF Transcript_32033/g.46173 Transcript_32033/m.46173 type:complete len:730 (+) Transcript_32033:13-2202(+)